MNNTQSRTPAIFATLAALMAASRFEHFGSAVLLPDASLAVFFLGGLYLAVSVRVSFAAFAALILEAGLIDYYVTSVEGISDWLMTPAYWLLIPTYASLWLGGRWFATRHTMQGKGLIGLGVVAWATCSFAFMMSNAALFLFYERFAAMSVSEYTSRIAQYYVSYVSFALLYIACAVAIHMAWDIIVKKSMHSRLQHTNN